MGSERDFPDRAWYLEPPWRLEPVLPASARPSQTAKVHVQASAAMATVQPSLSYADAKCKI